VNESNDRLALLLTSQKDKNKELEAKLREVERRLKDEKVLRENAESKMKALRKKVRGLKVDTDQEPVKDEDLINEGQFEQSGFLAQSSKVIERRAEDNRLSSGPRPIQEGVSVESTPQKGAPSRGIMNKLSPEAKIGGTPPRDPNSPVIAKHPIQSPTSTMHKAPLTNAHLPQRAPLSPKSPPKSSPPGSRPDKKALSQKVVPPLPGMNGHLLGSAYSDGGTAVNSQSFGQTQNVMQPAVPIVRTQSVGANQPWGQHPTGPHHMQSRSTDDVFTTIQSTLNGTNRSVKSDPFDNLVSDLSFNNNAA
jgi:hypothetical protein